MVKPFTPIDCSPFKLTSDAEKERSSEIGDMTWADGPSSKNSTDAPIDTDSEASSPSPSVAVTTADNLPDKLSASLGFVPIGWPRATDWVTDKTPVSEIEIVKAVAGVSEPSLY